MISFVDSRKEQSLVQCDQSIVVRFVFRICGSCQDSPDVASSLPLAHGCEFFSDAHAVGESAEETETPLTTSVYGASEAIAPLKEKAERKEKEDEGKVRAHDIEIQRNTSPCEN